MIVKQELIGRIKDYFNLNVYETKVWLALLGKGVASAGKLQKFQEFPEAGLMMFLRLLRKRDLP